jgi:structural maintenance of chromosome 4
MMKPKAQTQHEEGLLEYLEDIIGSNKYVTKIEQAAQKVEAANETRTEKLNRVKVVEKEREGLEVCYTNSNLFWQEYSY